MNPETVQAIVTRLLTHLAEATQLLDRCHGDVEWLGREEDQDTDRHHHHAYGGSILVHDTADAGHDGWNDGPDHGHVIVFKYPKHGMELVFRSADHIDTHAHH